jgi:protein-tyrosine-phosphatase
MPDTKSAPQSVLFLCTQNAVRSPMAAALLKELRPDLRVDSAGLDAGDIDYLMIAVMAELGHDLNAHHPRSWRELKPAHFNLILTLSPEAHHHGLEWSRAARVETEYWPTQDATAIEGGREQRLAAYRVVRDDLRARLKTRFQLADA